MRVEVLQLSKRIFEGFELVFHHLFFTSCIQRDTPTFCSSSPTTGLQNQVFNQIKTWSQLKSWSQSNQNMFSIKSKHGLNQNHFSIKSKHVLNQIKTWSQSKSFFQSNQNMVSIKIMISIKSIMDSWFHDLHQDLTNQNNIPASWRRGRTEIFLSQETVAICDLRRLMARL